MAKKTTSKKSSKKSSTLASADGMGISSPEDKITHLEALVKSLELELSHKVETYASTMETCESTKQILDNTLLNLEKEKELTASLMRDMTRQYKGMQDNLLDKINQREKIIQQLTDNLSTFKMEYENQIKEKDKIIQEKEHLIQGHEAKMNEMCENFASMIRNVTTQLTDRVIVQRNHPDKVPMEQLLNLQEFDYKSMANKNN